MEVIAQEIGDILGSLQPLTVDWRDDVANRVIAEIEAVPQKPVYTPADLQMLLERNFDDGLLMVRLFLGLSDDSFTALWKDVRGAKGRGVMSFRKNPDDFLADLALTGVLDSMREMANRPPRWNDVLVERLRSGRGSAISGQRRGRSVEDFAEAIVRRVFGGNFQARCTFKGPKGQDAKCDFAIPAKANARIIIEAKGYGATGSKMTDILGDIGKIISAKRSDTAFLFLTDGITWKQRKNDLRRIIEFQNNGDITRVYTYSMAGQLEADLRLLKAEYKL